MHLRFAHLKKDILSCESINIIKYFLVIYFHVLVFHCNQSISLVSLFVVFFWYYTNIFFVNMLKQSYYLYKQIPVYKVFLGWYSLTAVMPSWSLITSWGLSCNHYDHGQVCNLFSLFCKIIYIILKQQHLLNNISAIFFL